MELNPGAVSAQPRTMTMLSVVFTDQAIRDETQADEIARRQFDALVQFPQARAGVVAISVATEAGRRRDGDQRPSDGESD
jgi:hypothetical protein